MSLKNQSAAIFLFVLPVLGFLVVLAHSDTLKCGFYFDDSHILENNPAIQSLGNFKRFFTDITTYSSDYENLQYRPLVTLSLALNYAAGKLDPFGYHLVNLIIHYCCVVLVFLITRNLFGQWSASSRTAGLFAGLVSASVFAVHPMNVETINYNLCRSCSLATLFYMIGFLLYLRARERKSSLCYLLIPLFLVLSLLAKDIAGSLPVLLIFYDLWERRQKTGDEGQTRDRSIKRNIPLFLLCFILILYLLRGKYLVGEARFKQQFSGGIFQKIGTQSRAHLHYIRQFVFPSDFPIDPIGFEFSGISDPRSIISIFTLSGIAVFIFLARKKYPLLSFGLLWYFIALAPSSSIASTTQPINYHRPYIAMPGLCLVFSSLMMHLWNHLAPRYNPRAIRTAFAWLLTAILGWFVLLTHQQHAVWMDKSELWRISVFFSPQSGRAHMNLGLEYLKAGLHDRAEHEFMQCREMWPDYPYVYINLGVLSRERGELEKSDEYFTKAYILSPQHKLIVQWVANHFFVRGNYPAVIRALSGIIDDKPESASFLILRARAYLEEKDFEHAAADYSDAMKFLPGNKELLHGYCTALIGLERFEKVHELAGDGLNADSRDTGFAFFRALSSMKMANYIQARDEWNFLIDLQPDFPGVRDYLKQCTEKIQP